MTISSPIKDSFKTVTLDVRDLVPCEPMVKILEAAEKLKANERILALHRKEPHPLFGILKERGFKFSTEKKSEELFEIMIWRES